jgi:hypothetical protein
MSSGYGCAARGGIRSGDQGWHKAASGGAVLAGINATQSINTSGRAAGCLNKTFPIKQCDAQLSLARSLEERGDLRRCPLHPRAVVRVKLGFRRTSAHASSVTLLNH